MKYNYRLVLQYDGTRFNGWQKQGNTDSTIQGLLEWKLSEHLQEKIDIKGSGRTDSGVHASGQVANFYTTKKIESSHLKQWLNDSLPADIRVNEVGEVPLAFHSRKSATGKTYEYCIWNSQEKNVFGSRYAYSFATPLNIDKMKEAAKLLCGTHDFIGFSSLKESKKSTVRTIESITIKQENKKIYIQYKGNGFLYHMVRILTGTLIEVGIENMKPEEVVKILQEKNRTLAGQTVPSQGLKLLSVEY